GALVDLFLAGEAGAELCEAIRRSSPATRVLLISGAGRMAPAAARTAGASGFISKDSDAREVVELIAAGSTNREIAEELYLSPHTVKEHTSAVYRKLHARNRADAVQRAQRIGLLGEAALADLAGGEVIGVHAGDRAAVRQQPPAQRRRPVGLLRARGGVHHHRQRRRRQALRDEHPLLAPAHRLNDPAAGRLRVAGGGGARPQLPRSRLGRPRERLHQPQHDVPDLEPAAPRADAQG